LSGEIVEKQRSHPAIEQLKPGLMLKKRALRSDYTQLEFRL
jgi:hypothetical protein